jgi:hypothetical protein
MVSMARTAICSIKRGEKYQNLAFLQRSTTKLKAHQPRQTTKRGNTDELDE